MRIATAATCVECGRRFDLLDETDADEWHYGHDCEPEPERCAIHDRPHPTGSLACEVYAGEVWAGTT